MSYSDNMDNEQAPKRKKLLNQGWRIFQIKQGKEATSKSGNPMFIFTIQDNETDYIEDIYCVSTPGKRWILKCILSSCGIERNTDGNYNWDIPDVLNKDILGLVEHEPNEYINREGVEVKTIQHKIVDFKKYVPTNIDGVLVNDGKEVLWDDEHTKGITK